MENKDKMSNSRRYEKIAMENPFVRTEDIWEKENEFCDKIKAVVFTIVLLPIRVICIIILLLLSWSLAHIALYGYTKDDLKDKPVTGWRRWMRSLVGFLFRSMYFFGSANWIKIKGKLAPSSEAPILVGAPHSSYLDALTVLVSGPASVVGKIEAGEIPFYGKLIDFAQPIYVKRESFDSRAQTIQDILKRVDSTDDWPQIMIFPEGACTNGKALAEFKPGAFYPGKPIQPVLIRYPNKKDSYTWTWLGPNVFILLWRTLTQIHTFVEIEFLPVYVPNEEEITKPRVYAQNVQRLMAKALELPISDYSFDDCKLMDYALKCKLKFAKNIADISKLRQKLGLASSCIEEFIVKENFVGTAEYFLDFSEFVQRLKIPESNASYTLFSLFAENESDTIDFREYLFHALFLIRIQEPKIELLKLLFMLYGEAEKLQQKPFESILRRFHKISSQEVIKIFKRLDTQNRGYILFEDFQKLVQNDPGFERLTKPNGNFRQKKKNE